MNKSYEKLEKARLSIFKVDPLLNYLLQNININIIDCDKTAYTDGLEITFCKSFLNKLNIEAVAFVLVHELLHIILKHPKRVKNKNRKVFNVACDYIVNELTLEWGFNKGNLENILLSEHVIFQHSAEQLYSSLIKNNVKISNFVSFDYHDNWQEVDDSFIDELIKEGLNKGYSFNNKSINRIINYENYKTKNINWLSLLNKYIKNNIYNYTYKRIDNRYEDLLLPKFMETNYKLDNIWILFDVSGSVKKDELESYFNQTKKLFSLFNNIEFKISFFSNIVTKPIKINSVKQFEDGLKNIKTTGGTSFEVIYNSINKYFRKKPKLLIIFTDGYAKYPNNINQNTIWMISNNRSNPPFGKVVRI